MNQTITPRTAGYAVAFTAPDTNTITRYRSVGNVADDHAAIQAALAATRPGALARYAKRHPRLAAFVVRPNTSANLNGKPLFVEGYTLTLAPQ